MCCGNKGIIRTFRPSVHPVASLVAQLVKNLPEMQETLVQFLGWEDPWRGDRLPTPVFWPREFHELYSPWGHKESDTNEQLYLFIFVICSSIR